MNTLFFITDAAIGGAEKLLVTLGKAWPHSSRHTLVILMQPDALSDQLEDAFDKVYYLNFDKNSRNLLAMVRNFSAIVKRECPDVIWSHLFHADLVSLLSPAKGVRISTMHTHGLGPADHPLTRAIAKVVGTLSFRFSAVVPSSASAHMREFLEHLHMRHVVEPIPNGTALPAQATFSNSKTFTNISRNHPVKGHKYLLQAFSRIAAQVPDWNLRLIGPDVIPNKLTMPNSACEQLLAKGRISLEGPTLDPAQILSESGALVISSAYGEAFPIIGTEAAGCGVPVISTDVGSCSDFVDEDKFLVPPQDVPALAQALLDYAELSPAERVQLSQKARKRAEAKYSGQAVADKYFHLFQRLVK